MADEAVADGRDVTHEGERLIKAWLKSEEVLARAQSAVNGAACDLSMSARALGRWMCPGDAKAHETFCIWYGDSLIQVTVVTPPRTPLAGGEFTITIRARGRSLR